MCAVWVIMSVFVYMQDALCWLHGRNLLHNLPLAMHTYYTFTLTHYCFHQWYVHWMCFFFLLIFFSSFLFTSFSASHAFLLGVMNERMQWNTVHCEKMNDEINNNAFFLSWSKNTLVTTATHWKLQLNCKRRQ